MAASRHESESENQNCCPHLYAKVCSMKSKEKLFRILNFLIVPSSKKKRDKVTSLRRVAPGYSTKKSIVYTGFNNFLSCMKYLIEIIMQPCPNLIVIIALCFCIQYFFYSIILWLIFLDYFSFIIHTVWYMFSLKTEYTYVSFCIPY